MYKLLIKEFKIVVIISPLLVIDTMPDVEWITLNKVHIKPNL